MKSFVISSLLIFSLSSCNSEGYNIFQSNSEKTAEALVEEAWTLIFIKQDEKHLRESLGLLDEAIAKDKNYRPIYDAKTKIYCQLGRIDSSIITLKNYIDIFGPETEAIVKMGFYYEKLGDEKNADRLYNEAMNEYNRKLPEKNNDVTFLVNRAMLFYFTTESEEALKEFNAIETKFPDVAVEYMKEVFFTNFDRKKFIKEIC